MTNVEVLLVNPPCTEDTPAVPHEVGEPIGLCYLAQSLRESGFSVAIIDGFTLALSIDQLVELAIAHNPKICIGVSVLETAALAAGKFVERLRAADQDVHIVAGNYYATLNPERTFEISPGFSSLIRGEGEEVLPKLVASLSIGDESWKRLAGVCYMKDRKFVDNGICPQPVIDDILEPSRECLEQTLDAGGTANLVTGRGCYANCSFCSIVAFTEAGGARFRFRNPAAVVHEMCGLARGHDIQRFLIPDDNFMPPGKYRRPRVDALCDAIEDSGLNAQFTITCRVNDIHEDIVERLKPNGLVGVYLGIESFLPRRLKFFNKGVKPEANFRAFEILDAHKIFAKIGFIMYDPFITVDEVIEELTILRDRSRCPAVIHTSIDNLIRHSTYPLELQAGTPVQIKMSSIGRAFKTGAGYGYYFDHPNAYALSRFAEALLRFEGATFAPLRALSYRLSFGTRLDEEIHEEIDARCTALWKRFAECHFATYLKAAERLRTDAEVPRAFFVDILTSAEAELEELRLEANALIHEAALEDLERPWVRYYEMDGSVERSRVFDPALNTWHELSRAERRALSLWSRHKTEEIRDDLRASFDAATASAAVETIATLTRRGHFAGLRELETPYGLDDILHIVDVVLEELKDGKTGPRDFDYLIADAPHRSAGRAL